MDEATWLTSTSPQDMLDWLTSQPGDSAPRHDKRRPNVSDRRLRLFAVACCRQVWQALGDDRLRKAVEVAEKTADGDTTPQERIDAINDAQDVGEVWVMDKDRFHFSSIATKVLLKKPTYWLQPTWDTIERCGIAKEVQCAILRDLIIPFRPIAIDPAWRTPTVLALAEAAYSERAVRTCENCQDADFSVGDMGSPMMAGQEPYASRAKAYFNSHCICKGTRKKDTGQLDPDRLGVLSDALEEVGADEAILRHLRQVGNTCPVSYPHLPHDHCDGTPAPHQQVVHYRGCAFLDAILGKE